VKITVTRFFAMALLMASLVGCHPAVVVVPSYIQSIGVETATNMTSYYGLETSLTQDTIEQLQVDGRIPIMDAEKADLVIQLKIQQFLITPIFFDPKTNNVLQYQLTLTYDLTVLDKRENKTFIEDKGRQHSVYYYTPQYTGAINQTQDQATAQMMQETGQLIVQRVLEGF
jgi:hypothetical protein